MDLIIIKIRTRITITIIKIIKAKIRLRITATKTAVITAAVIVIKAIKITKIITAVITVIDEHSIRYSILRSLKYTITVRKDTVLPRFIRSWNVKD